MYVKNVTGKSFLKTHSEKQIYFFQTLTWKRKNAGKPENLPPDYRATTLGK